jgi:NarL family two-component system response regulator LiaR
MNTSIPIQPNPIQLNPIQPNPIQPNPIRVMVVDDHEMVRKGLAIFLKVNADLELVAEAKDGQEALRMCERVQPDVILMDLVMSEMDGTTVTRLIRERWPRVQVIALTSFYEHELVRETLQAGAIGYLLKDISVEDLAEAIRAAHARRPTLAPEVARALLQSAGREPTPGHDLTPYEHEALASMIRGRKSSLDFATLPNVPACLAYC